MKNFKIMARYEHKSWLDTYNKSVGWSEVKLIKKWYPSGLREVVIFPNGFIAKTNDCKICYVF